MKQPLEKLKSLADRNRLRIVAALMSVRELCACHIVELLEVSGATASRHMDLLIRSGLVESRKDGRWVHYRLSDRFPAPLLQWFKTDLLSDPEIKKDRRRLNKITHCKK